MQKNQIRVGIDFDKEENGPFYYKNYQKQVKRQDNGVYLYQCKLKLKKDRVNGQYPLHLWAEGKPKHQEESIHQEFTIYVEITDGISETCGKDDKDLPMDLPEKGGFVEETAMPLSEDTVQPAGEEKNSQPRLLICQNSLQGEFSGSWKQPALEYFDTELQQPFCCTKCKNYVTDGKQRYYI